MKTGIKWKSKQPGEDSELRQQPASSHVGSSLLVLGDKGLEGHQQSWDSVSGGPCSDNTGCLFCQAACTCQALAVSQAGNGVQPHSFEEQTLPFVIAVDLSVGFR